MGQQSNKIIKRRRRMAYLARKKAAARAAAPPAPAADLTPAERRHLMSALAKIHQSASDLLSG